MLFLFEIEHYLDRVRQLCQIIVDVMGASYVINGFGMFQQWRQMDYIFMESSL